jgi:hypothetical protein
MRVYFDSEISKVLSALTMVGAFAVFGFTVWKAIDHWQSETNLKEIQELVDQQES